MVVVSRLMASGRRCGWDTVGGGAGDRAEVSQSSLRVYGNAVVWFQLARKHRDRVWIVLVVSLRR